MHEGESVKKPSSRKMQKTNESQEKEDNEEDEEYGDDMNIMFNDGDGEDDKQ